MECWSIGVMYDIAEDPILQYSSTPSTRYSEKCQSIMILANHNILVIRYGVVT